MAVDVAREEVVKWERSLARRDWGADMVGRRERGMWALECIIQHLKRSALNLLRTWDGWMGEVVKHGEVHATPDR